MKNEPSKLSQLVAVVADDALAATFQTLAGYRRALLKETVRIHKQPGRLSEGPSGCDSGCCIARQVMPISGGGL